MTNMFEKSSLPMMRPITGMIRSLTTESTILPKAAPMITPTARSITLPRIAKVRNSLIMLIGYSPLCCFRLTFAFDKDCIIAPLSASPRAGFALP
ncbi:hypothetical protein D3C85_1524010 [compost metagenome]